MSKKYLGIIVAPFWDIKKENRVKYERTRHSHVDFKHALTSSILTAVGAEVNSVI